MQPMRVPGVSLFFSQDSVAQEGVDDSLFWDVSFHDKQGWFHFHSRTGVAFFPSASQRRDELVALQISVFRDFSTSINFFSDP